MARKRLLGVVVLGALAFLAAGCGAKKVVTAVATTPAGNSNRSTAFQAFTACLKQHGVTLPNGGGFFGRRPNGNGSGQPPAQRTRPTRTRPTRTPAQQKAFTACRSKLPSGGGGFFGGRRPNNNNPAFAKYTQCLKAHGVTFGQSSSPATFAKAQKACAKLRPSFGA